MALTIEILTKMMRVNKHRLDDELEIHPSIAHDISEQMATANAKATGLKEELVQLEASLLLGIRSSGEKLTAGEVTAELESNSKRVALQRQYQAAKKEAERWVGTHDAWKQRGFALRSLGDLYIASYFTVEHAGREQGYAGDRKRLAEVRQAQAPQEPAVKTRRRSLLGD